MKNFTFIFALLFSLSAFKAEAQSSKHQLYNVAYGMGSPSVRKYGYGSYSSAYKTGNFYLGQGKYELAIKWYTKALNQPNYITQNNYIDIYYKRGYTKYQAEMFDEAIADFNIVLAYRPDYMDAYNCRGMAEFYAGNYKAAFADIEYAIKLQPHHSENYYFRSVLSYHFQDYKTAIAYCDTALMYNPNNVHALKRRANAKYITLDFEGAISDYNKAITYDWENPHLYYCRGLAYSRLNQLDMATKDYYKAHQLNKNNPDYLASLNEASTNPDAKDDLVRLAFSDYK